MGNIYRVVENTNGDVIITTGGKLPLSHALNQAVLKASQRGLTEIRVGKAAMGRSGLAGMFNCPTFSLEGAAALAKRL